MDGLAGFSAIAAGICAAVAGILLAAFFATGRDALGRANDAVSALMAVLLMPPALTLAGRPPDAEPFMTVVTAIGLVGMATAAVASVLTAAGRLAAAQLTVWQGGSFLVLFAWVVASSAAIAIWGGLPVGLGGLGLLAGALVVIATIEVIRLARRLGGMAALATLERPPVIAMGATLAAFVAFPIWCIWLGLSLTA